MIKYTLLETLVMVGVCLLGIFLLIACHGCASAAYGPAVSTASPPPTIREVIYRTNFTPLLTIGGVFTGILLCGLVNWKMGLSVLAASLGATVYASMLDKFSWMLALLGIVLTVGSVALVLMKFRKTIYGFIDGIQAAKPELDMMNDCARGELNKALSQNLPAEAEALVKIRKAQLEKEKDSGN